MNKALGEMIFNGSILFLSISFGLFPSSADKIGIGNPVWFTLIIAVAVITGILSLAFSFYGIKKDNSTLIYASGICLLIMIIMFAIISFQSYSNVVSQASGFG